MNSSRECAIKSAFGLYLFNYLASGKLATKEVHQTVACTHSKVIASVGSRSHFRVLLVATTTGHSMAPVVTGIGDAVPFP